MFAAQATAGNKGPPGVLQTIPSHAHRNEASVIALVAMAPVDSLVDRPLPVTLHHEADEWRIDLDFDVSGGERYLPVFFMSNSKLSDCKVLFGRGLGLVSPHWDPLPGPDRLPPPSDGFFDSEGIKKVFPGIRLRPPLPINIDGGAWKSFRVECDLQLTPYEEGDLDESIEIWTAPKEERSSWRPLSVNATDLVAKNSARLIGGVSADVLLPEENRTIGGTAEGKLTVRWRNERAARLRDLWLLGIGALLGLAGAFLVEEIKAIFERRHSAS
jgi:hypothetical protein